MNEISALPIERAKWPARGTARSVGIPAPAYRHGFSRSSYEGPSSFELPRLYLTPGDLMICREPCEVTTVLGSCVAVTFFSARLRLAAICHAMLPVPFCGNASSDFWEQRWKYVSYALDELIRHFLPTENSASDVEVKIFGGAHLLPPRDRLNSDGSIGSANVALARRLLAEAGFAIRACDVGGIAGRKVIFDTRSGAVHSRRLSQIGVAA